MAKTPSNMLPLGTKAPSFELPDTVSGKDYSLDSLKSDTATVVMFICNHCPYVVHINHALVKIANEYIKKGIQFIAISSNDVSTHPQDGPEAMKQVAAREGYPFPYLYDESQKVAKDYQAACTPDFYIFDKDLLLVYRGQLDDSRPGSNIPVTGEDLTQALDSILSDEHVNPNQKPSLGCNIKWKDTHHGL